MGEQKLSDLLTIGLSDYLAKGLTD